MVKQQDPYIINFSLNRENHSYTNWDSETLENDKIHIKSSRMTKKEHTKNRYKHLNVSYQLDLFKHMAYKC